MSGVVQGYVKAFSNLPCSSLRATLHGGAGFEAHPCTILFLPICLTSKERVLGVKPKDNVYMHVNRWLAEPGFLKFQ